MSGQDGYFPRGGSLLRAVHEERAVGLMYGQRALGIGAISPLNFKGTTLHSRSLDMPFKRLVRTAKTFETIFFGTRAQADEALSAVRRLHDRVRGTLPGDEGPVPAGTPYSAYDPELMLWTIAVIADSARVFYEMFVRPLCGAERDELWREYVVLGELFGMPREAAPQSHADFERYWRARLGADEAWLSEEARHVGAAIMFSIPVPANRRAAMRLHNLVMLGSLPAEVRALYGLTYTPAQRVA
ncbi:MAG: DUF2236 domain-containing protein, partial [Acidobacteriota bacterium]|nr:DUF2236 domain-containing protein [Acidobacteriota bacterium]